MSDGGGGGWQNPSWNEPSAAGPGGAPYGAPPGPGAQNDQRSPPPGTRPPGAPKPGIVPLRPLGFGEVLDGAIGAVRRHPLLTLGLAAGVVTVQQILVLGVSRAAHVSTTISPAYFTRTSSASSGAVPFDGSVPALLGWGAAQFVSAVLSLVLTGMLVIVVGEAVLGRTTTFGSVWGRCRGQLWRLLLASIYGGLAPWLPAVVGGAVVGLLVGTASTGVGIAVGAAVFVLLLVFPGAYLWGVFALATPALMLERLGPVQALRRSFVLVRHDFWRVWGIRAVAVLIASVVSGVVSVPFGSAAAVIAAAAHNSGGDALLPAVLVAIGAIIVGTLVTPFSAGVLALLYIDHRMRSEGWDIELAETARTGVALPSMRPDTPSDEAAGTPPYPDRP